MLSSSLRRVGAKSTDVSVSVVQARRATTATLTKSKPRQFADSDFKRVKGTAKQLIEGAKQADNPEWRHTLGGKGERRRLEQDLTRKKDPLLHDGRSNASIFSGHPLENWTMEDLIQSGTSVLQPGTYFELRRNAESVNGVVLGAATTIGYNEDTLSINTRGEAMYHRTTDVMFAVPNFVDNYLVERCGTDVSHADQHQLAARLRVLKAARDFERAVEKEQYRLGRAIQDIYPRVRARHPDEWGKVTTLQVARMLDATPNVPIVTLFAVHRQLMDRADEYICHPSRHRFAHAFDVRPLSHLRNTEKVKQMVRDKSPFIHGFQQKARILIDRSRQLAAHSLGELPSRAEIVKTKFSEHEQEIITFLKLSMSHGRRIQQDSYESNVPAILKDTFRYDELITSYTTLRFLREIGVFTPWEDMASKDKDLHLPIVTGDPFIHTAAITKANSTVVATQRQTPGLLTEDAHENVRHDFGDLPVYVIDDVYAEELDDGISVEAVPKSPGTAWIHVHVADPTSVIPITHPLSQEIQKRTETYYFGHQTWPMLPADIGALCDMGRKGVHATGQNVLTFSAKVGPDGQIQDYKVRAGCVRNVHKLKYDDVNEVISPRVASAQFTPFEPEATVSSVSPDISNVLPHAKDLKLAFEVTRRLMDDRLKGNIFTFCLNAAEVTFLDKPVLQNLSHFPQPILYRGYPKLRYSVMRGEAAEVGSRSLIAECMKVAGRVASRFCSEHNIPAIRRAMPAIDLDGTTLSRILAARNELGFVDPTVLAREGVMLPPGELTTKPAGHWSLGIPDGEGYVRATSPLRRSEDIFMHWQIKSALLPIGGARPLISEDRMERIIEDLNGRKQVLKRAYRAHTRQWTHTYIQRFMEEQERAGTSKAESNPLRGMDAHVLAMPVYNIVRWSDYQDVYIPKLGLGAVLPIKAGTELPVGAHVKVNATTIFQYDLNQTLEVELA